MQSNRFFEKKFQKQLFENIINNKPVLEELKESPTSTQFNYE